jgi:CRP-like cAMP-binding protein
MERRRSDRTPDVKVDPLGLGLDETPDRDGAFPRLTEEQRARLRALGEVRAVQTGDVLYQEGDQAFDFFVIESGVVAAISGYGMDDRVIAIMGPHRFLADLNLLTGAASLLTAVVRDPGEVIQVPRAAFRDLFASDDDLGAVVLRAFLARRSFLIALGAGVRVLGSNCTPDSIRVREFLSRNRGRFASHRLRTGPSAGRCGGRVLPRRSCQLADPGAVGRDRAGLDGSAARHRHSLGR